MWLQKLRQVRSPIYEHVSPAFKLQSTLPILTWLCKSFSTYKLHIFPNDVSLQLQHLYFNKNCALSDKQIHKSVAPKQTWLSKRPKLGLVRFNKFLLPFKSLYQIHSRLLLFFCLQLTPLCSFTIHINFNKLCNIKLIKTTPMKCWSKANVIFWWRPKIGLLVRWLNKFFLRFKIVHRIDSRFCMMPRHSSNIDVLIEPCTNKLR